MVKRLLFIFAALFLLAGADRAYSCDSAACPLPHTSPWDRLVEKSFGLPKGLGAAVMTVEEWAEQKEIMFAMTPQQRHDYKKMMRAKLIERAKEKGIAIPASGKARVKEERDVKRPFNYQAKKDG